MHSRKKIEKSALKSSGVMTVFCTAKNAPASPAMAALTAKANSLMRHSDSPEALAASGLSRASTSPKPKRECTRLRTPQNASTTQSATAT